MTSHDVIAWLRKLFREKRIGHGGTLDPNVAGVLPIAVGKATRLLEYLLESDKKYRCEMILGLVTNTHDLDGDVLDHNEVFEEQIKKIPFLLDKFVGEIEQIPPMTSAIRQQGKRLYQLAHQGKEIARQARKINIYEIRVLETIFDESNYIMRFDVFCSKGTYIRTLCHDLGKSLGCGGTMSFLIRTETEGFQLADSFTLEEIQQLWENGQKNFLLPMTGILPLPAVKVEDKYTKDIIMGKQIPVNNIDASLDIFDGQKLQILDSKGLVAIGEAKASDQICLLQPRKVLR